MTIEWTAEGGTHGSNVTVANSGGASGTAISHLYINGSVTDGGTTQMKYDTASACSGSLGMLLTTSASVSYPYWSTDTSGQTRHSMRRAWKHQVPSANATILRIQASTSTAWIAAYTTGSLRAIYANGSSLAASASPVLTVDAWYWVEQTLKLESAAGAGDGAIEFRVWDAGRTLIHEYVGTALSTGTTVPDQYRGGYLTSAQLAVDHIDDVKAGALASGYYGPPSAPIVGTPTDTGPWWVIDATGLTGGVGAITHSISPSAGVVESPEGMFWVPQGGSAADYTVTSTDGVTPVDHVISVPAAEAGTPTDTIRRRVWTGTVWD